MTLVLPATTEYETPYLSLDKVVFPSSWLETPSLPSFFHCNSKATIYLLLSLFEFLFIHVQPTQPQINESTSPWHTRSPIVQNPNETQLLFLLSALPSLLSEANYFAGGAPALPTPASTPTTPIVTDYTPTLRNAMAMVASAYSYSRLYAS